MDQNKSEVFAERLVETLNQGSLALMLSIGHRTGLFDTMAHLPPATSEQIAGKAELDERYVREWLGAMATGGVVERDAQQDTYHLPAEHAACLTRSAAPNNAAAFAQYVGLLGGVEDRIVECFRKGGGVPYSAFPRFQEVMSEDSGQTLLPALVDQVLPLVPDLPERLDRGLDVLEVGFGMGRALRLLARTYPRSRFRGYEISEEGAAAATARAREEELDNVRFEVRDVARFDEPGAFDLALAFDAIHDQADPAAVLHNIARALRPGGIFLMQDIDASSRVDGNLDHPMGTFLYTVSCMHCMTVSLAQGGVGLGAMWGRELATEMLRDAGFAEVRIESLPHDAQNCLYVASRS